MIKPDVALSDLYLNLSVETGNSYYGSFLIYSVNNVDLMGTVLSTNDKVEVLDRKISGTDCEISFMFKGKMAIAGEEHYGDFLLITNGGEFNIPYCINVVPKKLVIDDVTVSTIKEFCDFAKENRKKAKEIFFSPEFQSVFLQNKEEAGELYRSLIKGTSKDVMLEQFLISAAGKQPVRMECEKELILDEEGNGSLFVETRGWGYLEGRIYSRNNQVQLKQNRFAMETGDREEYFYEISLKSGCTADEIVIETPYESVVVSVRKKEAVKEKRRRIKETDPFVKLLSLFVQFRTGAIETDEFLEKSRKHLPKKGNFYTLYDFQLALIEREQNEKGPTEIECIGKAKKIEERKLLYVSDGTCRTYYYYLQAFYHRNGEQLSAAAMKIREEYEKNHRWMDFLLLVMVDERLFADTKTQMKEYYRFLKEGVTSPFLYLAVLDVLNEEPYYLESLEKYRTALINWAIRHRYLSLELSKQYALVTQKEKQFRKKYMNPLMKLYEIRKEEEYLKTICSLFIKGSRTEKEYHRYFEDAFERELSLMGLNEYYLRTMDFGEYPVLPKQLILYFHYSSSLNHLEKAYLYANVLVNQEEYADIFPNYLIRMEQFVKEQLKEGRMNSHLCLLYREFLPEIAKEEEIAKHLPKVIFCKKLVCHNPLIDGVCLTYQEEEQYIPLKNHCCQIDFFSEQMVLFFVDAKGNRYHQGIEYELISYLNEEDYYSLCMNCCPDNKKVAARWLGPVSTGQLADLFCETNETKKWRREKTVERILDSHFEKKALEELSKCLDQINYRIINPSYRRTLMNYYMACDRMEDAYFGVELYGSDLMDIAQLYLLTCVGLYLHKEEKDDLLLVMAHRTFLFGKYNKDILLYLRKHFEGRNFDLLTLWKVLKKEGLDTAEYEEKVMNQLLFTGERDERILDVLLSYLEKETNDELALSLLEIYSMYYFVGRKRVPLSFFTLLERQVEKEEVPVVIKLSYLLWKSRTAYRKEEEEIIRRIMGELIEEQIVFDFFEDFESVCEIPSLYKEMTAFYGYDPEGLSPVLLLELEEEDGKRRKTKTAMREILPGFYYGLSYVPLWEQVTEVSVLSKDEICSMRVYSSKMTGEIKNSRGNILSRMLREPERSGRLMEQYESALEQMKQLKMLGV